jgi:hypothetical protein
MAKKDKAQNGEKQEKKRAKRGAKAAGDGEYSSIATHPQARAAVRKTKAWVGLVAFVLAAVLSLKASVPMFQSFERALVAGVAGYLLAWWASMVVWRHLMLAEQRAAVDEIKRRRAELAAADTVKQV